MSPRISSLPAGVASPLAAMHRVCFPDDPWDAAALGRVLELSGGFGYLAWEGDMPAGFLLARDLGGEIEVLSLGVMPEHRRHGIGHALLTSLAAAAEQRRCLSIVLEVATGNAAARRLYAACGFTQVGRRPHYYRSRNGIADALILRRSVTGEACSG